jgi:hypothetical protein
MYLNLKKIHNQIHLLKDLIQVQIKDLNNNILYIY